MNATPEDRAIRLALYIIENKSTVRAAAAAFGISKSTVHKDVTQKVRMLNPTLHEQVCAVLLQNKEARHLRGGEATRMKYLMMHEAHTSNHDLP